MNISTEAVPVYLDQNILSHLRVGKSARGELTALLKRWEEHNVVYVCSMTHVAECRDSLQPETFAEVLETLPVYLMDFQNPSDRQCSLSLGQARDLLLEPEDLSHHATRLVEEMLNVLHFASGWLGKAEAQDLKEDMAVSMAAFWDNLREDVDWETLGLDLCEEVKSSLPMIGEEMISLINDLPFEQARQEWVKEFVELRKRLPANYAQLDDMPDKEAVSFVLSCLGDQAVGAVERLYPQGFWSKLEERKKGDLAGLAFMLFMCGLVRDRRVKSGEEQRRMQYFRAQFRDGIHIENASRCAFFVTCDEGAARLARSLYKYAGVKTQVIELKICAPVA